MNPLRKILLATALAFFASGCLDRMAGSTSTGNTGKGTIAGKVVDSEGKGVANARVTVVGTDHNPGPGGSGGADAIAVTEEDGSFRTDSLPDGFYNLLGAKDGQVTFVDSVGVRGDSGSQSGNARLRAPGTVTGVVRLRPGHDSRTVFLILIGTTTFAVPRDSTGNFSLGGLAEGEYRLRLLSTLDAYAPLDTVIRAEAGKTIALPDTLRLPYLSAAGLPVLDYPELAYDTTHLGVRVSWKRQDPSKVAGYNIYRRPSDSGYARLTPAPIKDTFFLDRWDLGYRPDRVYEYAVTALDARGNEALKGFSSVFEPRPPVRVDTVIELTHCVRGPCLMDADSAGTVWVVSGDTSVLKVTASGKTSSWRYSTGDLGWLIDFRADDSGQVYMLMGSPMRIVKYDSLGRSQWEVPLPQAISCREDCLEIKRDTILVWCDIDQVLMRLSKDGALLRQDRVLYKGLYTRPVQAALPNQEIGLIGGDGFRELAAMDPVGNVLYRWNPVRSEYQFLSQFTMDSRGRWYLLWSDGRMEIYSPDRVLLRTIPAPRGVRHIEFRHGALYAEVDWALLRIPIEF